MIEGHQSKGQALPPFSLLRSIQVYFNHRSRIAGIRACNGKVYECSTVVPPKHSEFSEDGDAGYAEIFGGIQLAIGKCTWFCLTVELSGGWAFIHGDTGCWGCIKESVFLWFSLLFEEAGPKVSDQRFSRIQITRHLCTKSCHVSNISSILMLLCLIMVFDGLVLLH